MLIIAGSAAETAKAIMRTPEPYANKNRNTCYAKAWSWFANHDKKKLGNSRRLPAEIRQEIEELPSQAQSRVSNLSTINKSQCSHAKFDQNCLDAIHLSVQGHGCLDFSLGKP